MRSKHWGIIIGACLGLVLPGAALAEYVAYSVVEKTARPLPENIDDIEAKFLVNVKWGKYQGSKTRVGVNPVKNKSSTTSISVMGSGSTITYDSGTVGVPVDGIEAILTDVLHQTGRFRVVERTKLDTTIKEQDLGASGRVSKPSAAKVGKILGAQTLIQAVITHYEPNFKGNDIGLGGITGGFLGGLKIKSRKSMVGMNFRLIDAETSEVVFTKQVEAIMSDSGVGFGGIGWGSGGAAGGFVNSFAKTPVGQAVIAAVNKGVYELVKQVGAQAASGSVIKVAGSKVYVNIGSGSLAVGDRLTAISKGEDLVDPETGISLGGEEEEIGELKVTKVTPKYSIAKVVRMNGKLNRGDKVRAAKKAAPLQYAASWGGDSTASVIDDESEGD